MANTYSFISSVEVGSGGASTITFSSISSSFTDLKLVWSLRSNTGSYPALWMSLNSSTSNFLNSWLRGYGTNSDYGSGASGALYYLGDSNGSSLTSNTFSSGELYLTNYRGSKNKSWSINHASETKAAGARINMIAGAWNDTSAINSITLQYETGGGNFVQYSTAYLYGIKNS